MMELRQAVSILGLSLTADAQASDVAYMEFIVRGLPIEAVERISLAVCPNDSRFAYRLVSRSTLARLSRARRRLNARHSVLVVRLASVWVLGLRVCKSPEATREFLFRAHPILGGRPVDLVLANELGADLVRQELGRLEAGVPV
jgi:putative toxin-antitoxin system antitoxin component (TIGR02293 family)